MTMPDNMFPCQSAGSSPLALIYSACPLRLLPCLWGADLSGQCSRQSGRKEAAVSVLCLLGGPWAPVMGNGLAGGRLVITESGWRHTVVSTVGASTNMHYCAVARPYRLAVLFWSCLTLTGVSICRSRVTTLCHHVVSRALSWQWTVRQHSMFVQPSGLCYIEKKWNIC